MPARRLGAVDRSANLLDPRPLGPLLVQPDVFERQLVRGF
jgi:hypothetical protein